MIIRDATPDDAAQIAAYWNPQIRDTAVTFSTDEKRPDQLARELAARQSQGKAFLVACEGDKILGHASYFQFRSGPGYARSMEHTIILEPAACGQGIGQKLMQALEDHAKSTGAHTMVACISGENPGAIKFHEKIGYERVAILPEMGWKFDRWMDLVIMQKLLTAPPDNPSQTL